MRDFVANRSDPQRLGAVGGRARAPDRPRSAAGARRPRSDVAAADARPEDRHRPLLRDRREASSQVPDLPPVVAPEDGNQLLAIKVEGHQPHRPSRSTPPSPPRRSRASTPGPGPGPTRPTIEAPALRRRRRRRGAGRASSSTRTRPTPTSWCSSSDPDTDLDAPQRRRPGLPLPRRMTRDPRPARTGCSSRRPARRGPRRRSRWSSEGRAASSSVVAVVAALALGHAITSAADVSDKDFDPFVEDGADRRAGAPGLRRRHGDRRPARRSTSHRSPRPTWQRSAGGVWVLVSVEATATREPTLARDAGSCATTRAGELRVSTEVAVRDAGHPGDRGADVHDVLLRRPARPAGRAAVPGQPGDAGQR